MVNDFDAFVTDQADVCLKGPLYKTGADSALQAILELHWSPNSPTILTCSADKTLGYWDANAGKRKKTFKVHKTLAQMRQ